MSCAKKEVEDDAGLRHNRPRFPEEFRKGRRRIDQRSRVEEFPIKPEQCTELGLADTGGVLQHGLKHGLQLARRSADNLQHLRGRGLLLQRLR